MTMTIFALSFVIHIERSRRFIIKNLGSVQVLFEADYLLHTPARVDPRTLVVLTMHGFGQNPEAMLKLTVPSVGEDCIVASIRAPNQDYLTGNPTTNEVGYNWGTRKHPEANIRLHHDIVRAVSAQLWRQFGGEPSRTLLMGFSQPVGLNYRFIGTYPQEAGGVIALCGGVPKDWEEPKYGQVNAPILHISRSEDEFFPTSVVQGFPDRLKRHATDVEFHLLPGAHRFPSQARPLMRAWMNRVFLR
jgi:predicted esterase